MTSLLFTVVTHWDRGNPDSIPLVHSYGLYATRDIALARRREIMREDHKRFAAGDHRPGTLTVHVTEIIDIDAMNRENSR